MSINIKYNIYKYRTAFNIVIAQIRLGSVVMKSGESIRRRWSIDTTEASHRHGLDEKYFIAYTFNSNILSYIKNIFNS